MSRDTFVRILMLFFFALLFLGMALGFISCRAVKDQKAVERVLGNDDLTAKVGQRINKAPDTVTRVVDHVQFDTLTLSSDPITVYRIDTVLKDGTRIIVSPTGISARAKVQTITKTIVDRAEAERWRDSTDKLRREITLLYVENKRLNEHIAAIPTPRKGFPWWIVIVGLVVVGLLALVLRRQTWFILIFNKLLKVMSKRNTTTTGANTVTNTGMAHTAFPPPKPDGYINLYRVGKNWQFQVMAPNHEALTTSELYATKAGAKKGIAAFQAYRFDIIKETTRKDEEDI